VTDLLRNLGLSVAGVAVALGLAEACARAVDLRPAPSANAVPAWVDDRQLRRESHWIELLAKHGAVARYFELYQWDRFRLGLQLEMLDYAAPPRVRSQTAWTVETNERGFRDGPLSRRAQAGEGSGRFRVLALGDSSTFGWGVPAASRYSAVAESILRARHPELDLEVRNLGVPGYSSFQGLVLLERVALDLEPDALLFSFGSNDRTPTGVSDREVYARREKSLGALQAVVHRSRGYETGVAWWNALRGAAAAAAERLERKGRENVSRAEFAENLHRAAALARERNLPLAFVSNCLDREGLRVMGQVAREVGAPFVNGHAAMVRRIPELRGGALLPEQVAQTRRIYGDGVLDASGSVGWVLLPDRCHPNRVGHALIGEAVADVVEAWLP
jgi:lysophospholipase L1-like esterase